MNTKKIGLGALVLMLFTTIFGFGNGPVAFYQMGLSGIIWYILGAVLFFLPTSMMYAEYGASYKGVKGGLYSWMEEALGQKWAFIATFIGLASWVIWMVSTASKIWVAGSNMVFDHDETSKLSFLGLDSNATLGLLAVLWVVVVAFLVTRGVKSVSRVASLGGLAVMAMNVILVIASVVILFANGGDMAEPVNGLSTFTNSPNPQFQNPIGLISFALFAIFAYGGLEQSSGVMDSVKDPEKTYPKAVIIATIVIGIGYSLAIFLWGVAANYSKDILGNGDANLGNITYILMNNLGVKFGDAIGLSSSASSAIGSGLARFTGLGMTLAYAGSFFVLSYAPIKAFILGTPKKLWPSFLTKLNKAEIPAGAVWLQAGIVILFILGVAFTGGKGGDSSSLFAILTNMANVAVTLPYVFLIFAFPLFKNLKNVPRPFVFYKNKTVWTIVTWVVLALVVTAIVVTIIEPVLGFAEVDGVMTRKNDYVSAFWTIAGPVLFGVIAWIFYAVSERRTK